MESLSNQAPRVGHNISSNAISTGCSRHRQAVQLIDMPGRWCLYGVIGALSHELDAGGPLDAPSVMPAGSTNNTEWRDSRGQPLVAQTEAYR